jgi:cyclopropane fatty-acyl-phospholipid synthase-like methyltransferase
MNKELFRQKNYWDRSVNNFDAIYSHNKSQLGNLIDKLLRWDMYKRFDYTIENSQPITGRTFLDVGCGTGKYSFEFALHNANFVVGLDISENMIRTCTERAHKLRISEHIKFICSDLLEYTPDMLFDVCIGIGLFDYIREPLPVLRKMRECARDKVIISFPSIWTWKAPVRKIKLSFGKCDVFFYTKNRVKQLIDLAGFREQSIHTIGQLYCVTALK